MPLTTDPDAEMADADRMVSEILEQYRSLLRELRIEAVTGGVVLHGRARTFYGKQVALHEFLRRCSSTVLANRIVVGH